MICVCKHCQKQFVSQTRRFACDECKELDDMRYEQIKAYLDAYPNSNAIQISEALGIKATVVLKYVDEGRLEVAKGRFEKI